jgi:hypothetical protein
MNCCTEANEAWYSQRSQTCLQVLCQSVFCFMELLSMAMMRNFKVMLGQTRNRSVRNSVLLCNIIS